MRDWFPLWLSLKVSLTATAIAAVCGVGLAYFLARTKMVGRGLIEAVATLPIVLPPTVLGYYLLTTLGVNSAPGRAWAAVFGRPLVFTQTAAVIAASISAFPFVVRTARVAIEEVDLRLEEVARIAGHRSWWVALRVTLPLARNGILAGIGLGFARAWRFRRHGDGRWQHSRANPNIASGCLRRSAGWRWADSSEWIASAGGHCSGCSARHHPVVDSERASDAAAASQRRDEGVKTTMVSAHRSCSPRANGSNRIGA